MRSARPRSWVWALVVLAGSAVRFWFGTHYQLWNCAPDQLAWGHVLDDVVEHGDPSYARLIHYPHEGGSLLLSLLALALRPLGAVMPPLSWAAFLVDALSRYLQIRMALHLFGPRTTSGFAIWSVLAVPLLLPWATVDFGLHALMSFAPLLLVRYATAPGATPFRVGVASGIGIFLAYDVLVFVPAFIAWMVLRPGVAGTRLKSVASFISGCALALIPHFALRFVLDNGFHLEELSALTVRGLPLTPSLNASTATRILFTASATLPASLLLHSIKFLSPEILYRTVLAFLVIGSTTALFPRRDRSPGVALLGLTVVFFVVLFAIGPFYMDRADGDHYVRFRHFSFIVPTLVLFMLNGFSRVGRPGVVLTAAWCALCAAASIRYMHGTPPCEAPNERAAGWVLGRKFGHDPSALMSIARSAPQEVRRDLVVGYGWGITATLLEGRSGGDVEAVAHLRRILHEFPRDEDRLLIEGVHLAFEPGITPVLDPDLLKRLDE